MRVNDSEVEALDLLVVTDAAFVEHTLMLKHICLAGFTLPKTVEHGFGNRVLTISDCVDAAVSFPNDLVVIRTVAKVQLRVSLQNLTTCDRFQRAAHRICQPLDC